MSIFLSENSINNDFDHFFFFLVLSFSFTFFYSKLLSVLIDSNVLEESWENSVQLNVLFVSTRTTRNARWTCEMGGLPAPKISMLIQRECEKMKIKAIVVIIKTALKWKRGQHFVPRTPYAKLLTWRTHLSIFHLQNLQFFNSTPDADIKTNFSLIISNDWIHLTKRTIVLIPLL